MSNEYYPPILAQVERDFERNTTQVTTVFIGEVDKGQLERASALVMEQLGIREHVKADPPAPATPMKAIFNDPATVVLWSDGTKTVAKATGCDEYEPMRGVMTCAMRKVGRNRVRTESWDDVIAYLADSVADADECRVLSDMLYAAADILDTGDTMRRIVEWDAAHADADEGEQEPLFLGTDGTNKVAFVATDGEAKERENERVRALIRDLIDKGEL